MDEGPRTEDGNPIAGWILRSTDAAAVTADLKEFGQVFRFAVPAGPRIDTLDAGQPCFLFVSEPGNATVKPGIWAVGEVVGPCTVGEEDELFAEVELLPLQQRIPLASLNEHRTLSRTELLADPGRGNPFVIRTEELRALEEWDFDLVEPTEEQTARLEEVLAEDDGGLIFQLVGVHFSLGIVDDGVDGLLSVVSVSHADGAAYELGRYEAFADALEAVASHGAELELEPAGLWEGDEPGGDPVAVLDTDDGAIGLYRAENELVLWDDGELARFADLSDALAALAATVEEI